ncbi:hypothetical protein IKF32_00805 [Candidatus Saccharibacteria bacterium]|nr:hypothetical protein [Candidatus Saccharibacteria bacterium]
MKTKIISILSIIFSSLLTAIPVFAECSADVCNGNYPESVKAACGCTSSGSDALPTVITAILNSIIGVAGLVAVIYIIIGGINYMTSAGDTSKVEKAKKTILYAVIGLVICVLAFGIVNWAISTLS